MWALRLALSTLIKRVEYVLLPPLGPQNATGPPSTIPFFPAQICLDPHICTPVSTAVQHAAALSPLAPQSPQPISPSHISEDHTHHNIKYLEQLLESSLATIAVIQFSGNNLENVLTPRAYDTVKALYALAALDVPASESSTKPRGGVVPPSSTSSDIGNDCPYSSNRSPPLLNSSLVVPRTGRDYVMLLSGVGLAAVSCLVFFTLPRLCERIFIK